MSKPTEAPGFYVDVGKSIDVEPHFVVVRTDGPFKTEAEAVAHLQKVKAAGLPDKDHWVMGREAYRGGGRVLDVSMKEIESQIATAGQQAQEAKDQALKDLLQDLKTVAGIDEATFYKIVQRCFEQLDLSEADLARDLNIHRATVEQWRRWRYAPHAAMRPLVFQRLQKRIERRIKRNQRRT